MGVKISAALEPEAPAKLPSICSPSHLEGAELKLLYTKQLIIDRQKGAQSLTQGHTWVDGHWLHAEIKPAAVESTPTMLRIVQYLGK